VRCAQMTDRHPPLGAAAGKEIHPGQNFFNASAATVVLERTAMRNIAKLCLACACASVPAAAHAEGGDSGGMQISVTVPEVCQIDASTIVHEETGLTLASVLEMCNSGHGFTIFASHRSLEAGEQV